MPSSESVNEEDSFRARVDKIFGSLSSSSSKRPPSIWSLTGEEVEKREWKRSDKDDPTATRDDKIPCSSSLDRLFKSKDRKILHRYSSRSNSSSNRNRLQEEEEEEEEEDLNDDDDEGQMGGGSPEHSFKRASDGDGEDEWEMRSSIGLDCTLDYEEEEDEYDKVAEGRESAGDRLYMRDVTDHGPYLNSHNVLPNSVHDAPRDPRSDLHAARIRLKEDEAAAAEKFDSYQTCDISMLNAKEPFLIASEDGVKLKSILKRKDGATLKSSKRVRFDPACKDQCEEASQKHEHFLTGAPSMGIEASDDDSFLENTPRVPGYVLNPSKYVCYSFDSSHGIDEESNSQACMDFLEPLRRSKPLLLEQMLKDASVDLPKSVTFIPRKKASDAKAVNNSSEAKQNQGDGSKQSLNLTGPAFGIAAGEVQQSEVNLMGEDEPETDAAGRSAGLQKRVRHYRTKSRLEDTVS